MIVEYYKWLVDVKHEYIMSKQILRSGTSIGANIYEAKFAASKADFINKLQISLKETSETEYWLIVLQKTGYYSQQFDPLEANIKHVKNTLIKSINTAKSGSNN